MHFATSWQVPHLGVISRWIGVRFRRMRALFTILLVIGAISAICVLPAGASTAATARPVLSVSVQGPIVISGTRFKPNERVTLRFVAVGRPSVKIVRSTPGGRLTARLPADHVRVRRVYCCRAAAFQRIFMSFTRSISVASIRRPASAPPWCGRWQRNAPDKGLSPCLPGFWPAIPTGDFMNGLARNRSERVGSGSETGVMNRSPISGRILKPWQERTTGSDEPVARVSEGSKPDDVLVPGDLALRITELAAVG